MYIPFSKEHQPYTMIIKRVVGVINIGNIVPRTGIEPTPLAFWASMLTITSPRLSTVNTLPTPTGTSFALEVSADYYKRLHLIQMSLAFNY